MHQIPGFDILHRIVPAARRSDLSRSVRDSVSSGALSDLIYSSYRRIFACPPPPPHMARTGSLIVGAVPQPMSQVPFAWKGRRFELPVPPSYIQYWELTRKYETSLNEILAPTGYSARFARVPQKLLAVRSGLAFYGRNNIAYVPGLGSALLLVSYYSDRPWRDDTWREPSLMDRCRRCRACLKACPTGAIREDPVPIRQDRCLTFYSGYSGPQELPPWLDTGWIDCLIGCARCQAACPENKVYLRKSIEQSGFTEEETRFLLLNKEAHRPPPLLRQKLENLGLIEFFGEKECAQMLARKLAIFIPRVEAGTIASVPYGLK